MNRQSISHAEIAAYNKINSLKTNTEIYLLNEQTNYLNSEELQKHLCSYHWPQEERFDDPGERIDEDYACRLEEALNLKALPNAIEPAYAVCVKNTNLRLFPTLMGSYKAGQEDIDYFAQACVKIGEKVLVWHRDLSGSWHFVQTKNAWGWVEDEALAWTEHSIWQEFNEENFLQINVPCVIPKESKDKNSLLFGTRLPLLAIYADKYLAMLPERDKNGRLGLRKIYLPKDGRAGVGHLPLNSENILTLACEFLGERYDWGGKYGRHDCTSLLGDIYGACGVNLAGNSTKQLLMAGVEYWDNDLSPALRRHKTENLTAGSILLFKGHGMLYLGRRNGYEVILHSVYRLSVPSEGRFAGYDIKKTTVGCLEQYRENGRSLLDSIEGSLDLFQLKAAL